MSNHSFDIHIAEEYKSVDIAILTWHFQYWIMKNKRLGRNEHDGRTWTYQTIEEIAAVFPYWSGKQVERLLNKAVELDILIKGNFNKAKFDRTLWYAFKNEGKFSISRFREMEIPESGNPSPEIGRPIPDTLPDTLPDRERAKPSKRAPDLIERALHVNTSEEEHQRLVQEHGEELTKAFYERLSIWKQRTEKKKWKLNDNLTIRHWVIKQELDDKQKPANPGGEKNDRLLAEKIWNKMKGRKEQDIELGYKYLEFKNGMTVEHIEFGDKEFKKKALEQLRKRKISTEGL